jgi:hypothetical protein
MNNELEMFGWKLPCPNWGFILTIIQRAKRKPQKLSNSLAGVAVRSSTWHLSGTNQEC